MRIHLQKRLDHGRHKLRFPVSLPFNYHVSLFSNNPNSDIYRTFHPKTINFTFFSSAHGSFSRIDHILGHKSSLGKFKKIGIIPVIFSDHSAVRLDLNYRKKNC